MGVTLDMRKTEASDILRELMFGATWLPKHFYGRLRSDAFLKPVNYRVGQTNPVHAYISTYAEPQSSVGVAAQKGYWDLDHSALYDVRRFIEEMVKIKPDITGQLAGAGATKILAMFGAQVIRVEDRLRQGQWDIFRGNGPWIDERRSGRDIQQPQCREDGRYAGYA